MIAVKHAYLIDVIASVECLDVDLITGAGDLSCMAMVVVIAVEEEYVCSIQENMRLDTIFWASIVFYVVND